MNWKRVLLKNKNNKLLYYVKAISRWKVPSVFYRSKLVSRLGERLSVAPDAIQFRVDYYNRLDKKTVLSNEAIAIKDYKLPKKIRVYFFDSICYLKYFNPHFRFRILPGDVTHIPEEPCIVKSRPIVGDNANSVILKLDKSRHFNFIKDEVAFSDKKDLLVGRSGFNQPHRARFYTLYKEHPLCDLKKATRKSDAGFLSIAAHLNYKFVLALEGNDVATNLKWIMSSNSIAVMPRPTYETWYMEGTLIPDYHYICIADDFSDLEEKLTYYIEHPEAAEEIVKNAHQYIEQFKDEKVERQISLRVLDKYFQLTNN
ncbi:MAG: glycosyltransferase [Sphingobacterium sp.]|jgi:hypothetical protein|nr:glycosyltransferase [Sphingobacterium sp.]